MFGTASLLSAKIDHFSDFMSNNKAKMIQGEEFLRGAPGESNERAILSGDFPGEG